MDVGQVGRDLRECQCIVDTRRCSEWCKADQRCNGWKEQRKLIIQAPRPSPGPHKLRESLPLTVFLRNRLKYALTGKEVTSIVKQRTIKVDGKVRTDETFPAGFMG